MQDLLAMREPNQKISAAELMSAWSVTADESYRIVRREAPLRQYTAFRVLGGWGELTRRNGEILRLEANAVGILPIEDVMSYRSGPDGWRFYWFEFNMQPPVWIVTGVTWLPLSAQEDAELERCFLALRSGSFRQCALAESLFNYLLSRWQLGFSGGVRDDGILSLLEQGRRQRMSIPRMAQLAGMSERSFRDAVHSVTGLPPKAYMLKGEMEAAMELLRTTDMSISEIAACFDYSSPLYFSRVFKKYYGISPQNVRDGITF